MTTGTRETGDFCWINMLTPRPEAARRFFGQLLGWTFTAMPGVNGHVIEVGGHQIGGMFDVDDPNTPKGTPPLIGVMVKVDSADETGARAASLGGTARPPMDIFDAGRMVVCIDPTGGNLDVWQPKKLRGTDVDSRRHGAPSWFEERTPDMARATAFYTALFGWRAATVPSSPVPYTVLKRGDTPVAGVMPGERAGWMTYFTVDDVEGAARTAEALGAKGCTPIHTAEGVGRFIMLTSPEGVPFAVIQYTSPPPM